MSDGVAIAQADQLHGPIEIPGVGRGDVEILSGGYKISLTSATGDSWPGNFYFPASMQASEIERSMLAVISVYCGE